jgi:hypothetical protein
MLSSGHKEVSGEEGSKTDSARAVEPKIDHSLNTAKPAVDRFTVRSNSEPARRPSRVEVNASGASQRLAAQIATTLPTPKFMPRTGSWEKFDMPSILLPTASPVVQFTKSPRASFTRDSPVHNSAVSEAWEQRSLAQTTPKVTVNISPLDAKYSIFRETNELLPYSMIKVTVLPYDPDSELGDIAFATRFTADFFDRMCDAEGYVAFITHNSEAELAKRRYSPFEPDTLEVLATAKGPDLKGKTNPESALLFGRLAEDPRLQTNPTPPEDYNFPGELPAAVQKLAPDLQLTKYLQEQSNPDIIAAYRYHNLICYTKLEPVYDTVNACFTDTKVPRHYLQDQLKIYRIINKIKEPNSSYKFVSFYNLRLTFTYKNIECMLDLSKLMPPIPADSKILQDRSAAFFTLEDFENYIQPFNIRGLHAAVFCRGPKGHFVPATMLTGYYGGYTSDADAHVFGKRFDMPREAYAIFSGFKRQDYPKFLQGLKLLHARITCASKAEYKRYIDNCAFDVTEYISQQEIDAGEDEYLNYQDPNNFECFSYYKDRFLPALEKAIEMYQVNLNAFSQVCTSDLHNIVTQVKFAHRLSIHAAEDTNLKPGTIGVNTRQYKGTFLITANEESHLADLFSDRSLLSEQIIGVNPYYLREREPGNPLSDYWLDVIYINCLNKAKVSMFEFEMHWLTIIRRFEYAEKNGPKSAMQHGLTPSQKVNAKLSALKKVLAATDPDSRNVYIDSELTELYDKKYRLIIDIFNQQILDQIELATLKAQPDIFRPQFEELRTSSPSLGVAVQHTNPEPSLSAVSLTSSNASGSPVIKNAAKPNYFA